MAVARLVQMCIAVARIVFERQGQVSVDDMRRPAAASGQSWRSSRQSPVGKREIA